MITKILVVDDDHDIVEILRYNLSLAGYDVKTANNGKEALKKAKLFDPQIILLDVMMPVMNGIETCSKIKNIPNLDKVVIVFLSARSEDFTQISAFDAGGDDYIAKPVKPKILLKKLESIVKRINPSKNKKSRIEFGNLIIDRSEYQVKKGKQDITLPRKEFELFFLLASRAGKVCTRDEIMNKVWGSNVVVVDRTIDVHIRKLREKIGNSHFKTIKGVGYKFVQ
jgi:two-component system alkaline phosphatase synthesis response regulator PhoP